MDKKNSAPHTRTRTDHANETAEDYCEAVAELIADSGECRVGNLAAHFAVSHVTVSRIVKRLQSEGLMETEPFKPVFLTERGSMLAKQSRERHEVVLNFLMALGVDEKTAQIDSEGIEHHVSPETLEAMKRYTASEAEVADLDESTGLDESTDQANTTNSYSSNVDGESR